MALHKIPFYNRILFWFLLPVILVGFFCSTMFVTYMSSPLKDFLVKQFDANLQLASTMGLNKCEESLSYLLDLRLEKNSEMNHSLQNEAMEVIKNISTQFPNIHLMVLESNKSVKVCSLNNTPKKMDCSIEGQNNKALDFKIDGKQVKSYVQFFPFWDWHIVSFVFEKDYKIPIRMAYTVTYLSSFGVFIAVVSTLLLVFNMFIKKPINKIIKATEGVSEGNPYKFQTVPNNEFGILMKSFNGMIDSLENEKAEVRSLISQLKESEALFRSQFEYGNIGIAITTVKGDWIRANERLCEILGYTEEELKDKAWSKITHHEDFPSEMSFFYKMLAGEIDSYEIDKRLYNKKREIVYVHLNVSCFRNRDRSVRFVIGSILDITTRTLAEFERERLGLQLQQAQKMESIGHLAGGIAHDFNNMLSIVMGHTELAMIDLDPDTPVRKDLNIIQDAAKRSKDLVRHLLAYARKQTISPKILSINDTISGMLKMLKRLISEDIDLAWMPGKDILGKMKIDPAQVDQVLTNLIINARDSIGGVGKITIETDEVVIDEEYCLNHTEFIVGKFVLFVVSDSGVGMDEKTIQKIFDPFFTTKELGQGTGLGLATVYGIVKQNNGFINVYSEKGEGTTFKIYFPVTEAREDDVISYIKTDIIPKGTETILVVEDDKSILNMVESILKQLGYNVITANSPNSAIDTAEPYEGKIDLLITDVVMPQMNGKKLAHKLNELNINLKCLFMSGYTANVIAHRGVLDEGIFFLQKPFSIMDLALKVREVLDKVDTSA
ncbi:MAG: PAS domain S-box protein [Deltaproteobacteria bacterium]|nr:PAS domain S-box protein [Deltaproteobacteria bacterium]